MEDSKTLKNTVSLSTLGNYGVEERKVKERNQNDNQTMLLKNYLMMMESDSLTKEMRSTRVKMRLLKVNLMMKTNT